jgi:hypothetical protein
METTNTSITPFGEGFSASVYDTVKKLVQLGFPAAGALYFGLSEIWGFPAGDKVVGSLTLLTTFFGVLLSISAKNYATSGAAYDGQIVVDTNTEGKTIFQLQLDEDPEAIPSMDKVSFKVVGGDEQFWGH